LLRDIYEADFFRLIRLLEVKPEELDRMLFFASQITHTPAEEENLETKKAEAIALGQ